MNKLLTTALVFLSFVMVTNAQLTHFVHHYSNGQKDTFLIADVDSITYITIASTGTTCPATITDVRDGEVYAVVAIGNQCWMAENLRYNASGSLLNTNNPDPKYGRLYSWGTLMNGASSSSASPSGVQGVCPAGWHIPSDAEWNTLELALGMPASGTTQTGQRGTHDIAMKSTTGWNGNNNGTNSSGFNAFPAGYHLTLAFVGLGDQADFWSATEAPNALAWGRNLNVNSGVARLDHIKDLGFSCRCVKD
jgi:uncharacterized protein (TIGR02145 family)